MFVRDIVERPTAKASDPAAPPQPPRPPIASKGGFPVVTHRSKGPSAFARARKDDAVRRAGGLVTGEGRVVENVPAVQASASAPSGPSDTPMDADTEGDSSLSEGDKVRRAVGDANTRRVLGMTDAEREQEAEELKERFGGGVVELMRKRREAREGGSASTSAATSAASAVPSTPPTVTYKSTADLSDTTKILAAADEENAAKVSGMSAAQVDEEVRDLEERFGASLMGKLRARALERAQKDKGKAPIKAYTVTEAKAVTETKETAPPSATGKKSVRFDPNTEETTPAALRKKYFANQNVSSEDVKLQWMQSGTAPPPSKASLSPDPKAPRFDLSGAPLTPEAAEALPTHLGLHHHGDQPDLAGYTLAEIIHLCYSTVPSQRITMMGVLGRIITRYTGVKATDEDPWVIACAHGDVVGKGVDVACGVLGGHTRSIGVFVAAVDLLFTALGGTNWQWMDIDTAADARPIAFHPEPSRDGEPTGVAAVPFSDLAPRLSEVLALDPGSLPPTTLAQLLRIIQRAAFAAPQGAEAIVPLLPPLLKSHVLRAPWPLDPNNPPSRVALRILRDTVTSSRAAAEALMTENVFQPLLKFLAVDITPEPLSLALVHEVLRIFFSLGRYGLLASIATSAREIWQSLGTWVTAQLQLPAEQTTTEATAIVIAYFDLLRIWTICAVDPHRTTPEHDLTWAQVSALQWSDEELTAIGYLARSERWRELAAVLSVLAEYVAGSGINGAKKGEAEKAAVLAELNAIGLVDALPQGVDVMPATGSAARDHFNTALAEVFRLHNLLQPVGTLLNSPERERLVWWFMATTQSNTVDVYLRHEALAVARTDGVLDTAKWATSSFDLMLSCDAGDEPLALAVVDSLLRADWNTLDDGHEPAHIEHEHADAHLSAADVNAAVKGIGHKDSLEILRPLLHHTVLPDLENILGPTRPSYLYLKATGTLRPAPARTSGPGLPLAQDWAFSPLDELLSSGSSAAFALAPSDWDAGETQLTRATLAFAAIQAATARPPPRSLVLLNAMKVFMLEHGQQDAPNQEQDVFRDDAVHVALTRLLDGISTSESSAVPPVAAPLEAAAQRFLTPGVPFFQFYTDLLALYEGISFGDAQFARVLLPPLAMGYASDYRKLFWADQPGSLRSVRVSANQVPLESTLDAFFAPLETSRDILLAQARALAGTIRPDASPFLFAVATHHVAGLFWTSTDTERTSLRVQIMIVVLSSAPDAVVRAIVARNVADRAAGPVDAEEQERRAQVLRDLTGPRGAQRLAAAGL